MLRYLLCLAIFLFDRAAFICGIIQLRAFVEYTLDIPIYGTKFL